MNTALTSALLHFLWQGAAIAFLLTVALSFAKWSRTRYALACAALFAMPLAFGITFALSLPPEPLPLRVPVFLTIPPTIGNGSYAGAPTSAPLDPTSFWMAGVALLYGYRFIGWLSAQRLRRRGVCAAPQEWQNTILRLSARVRLSRPVVLLESALTETPVTIGIWKPVILLPLGLLAGLPADQVEAILLHELAHIRRHDFLVNLLQTLVEGLLFYHPATWWVSRTIRREREMCCDDLATEAMGDVITYTKALATLAERRVRVPLLAASGGPLMLRIHRLLHRQTPVSQTGPALVFLLLAAGAALFAFQPEPAPIPDPVPAPSPAPDPEPQVVRQPDAPAPTATPAPAPTPASFAFENWVNEDVVWIISPEERTAFRRLETDEERQKFIEQFWLRRDPTPDTRVNELMEEHYRRVAWSNEKFGAGFAGWKSDRGMVYIKFGPPDEKEEHPVENGTLAYEKWRYKLLDGVGTDVVLEFVDKDGDGTYRMTWDPSDKQAFLRIPGAGLTLYQQMELANGRETPVPPTRGNLFERLPYADFRTRPTR